jgi:hypothetical protein
MTDRAAIPGGPRVPVSIAAAVLTVVLASACVPTPARPTPSPSAAPTPTPALTPSIAPTPSLAPGAVPVDDTLLAVLPQEVDGVRLRADPTTAAEIGASGLPDEVTAIAVGLYVDLGTGGLAVANVVALDGAVDEAWFRGWRESYDAAACEIAGGLEAGRAEADIGHHRTQIGTCTGGAHTYHVTLSDPDRIVSITAISTNRLGEHVIAGLAE